MKERIKESLRTGFSLLMCVLLLPLAFIAMLDDQNEVDTDEYN